MDRVSYETYENNVYDNVDLNPTENKDFKEMTGKKSTNAQSRSLGRRHCFLLTSLLTVVTLILIVQVVTMAASLSSNKGTVGDKPEQGHSACIFYNVLDSFSRNVATKEEDGVCTVKCCDQEGTVYETSPDWKGMGWYRFMGAAGSKIPDSPVGQKRCGTYRTTWISGGHPNNSADYHKEVMRTINIEAYGRVSSNTTDALVVNCGDFYVYYLKNAGICNSVYCGE